MIVQLFLGSPSTGPRVDVAGGSHTATALSPADATMTWFLTSTGLERTSRNGSPASTINTWLNSGVGADYDVRATIVSGTVTTGTTGSWLSLSGDRTWTKTRTSDTVGTDTVQLTIEIRDAVTLVVLETANLTLSATVDI